MITVNDIYKEFDKFLENKTDAEKLEIINEYENKLILQSIGGVDGVKTKENDTGI